VRDSFGLFVILLMSAAAIAAVPQSSSATQVERVAVGDQAIDFTMESIDGETYRLSDLRGEKSAIIIFFRGTW
jgi:cytochrome oxidase Cu insertion factor (SCO1/SenC/PrrC family)|tara:strand:+ start:87 stop:305 length:219 start_codon:yes stop_codon:yes gene_type:complete